jgi:hypothetical protein
MPTTKIFVTTLCLLLTVVANADDHDLEASYHFLVSDRDTNAGVLYTVKDGELRGKQLPLSYVDSPAYWGDYVCKHIEGVCNVTDTYNQKNYTLLPPPSPAGGLQTERVYVHGGTNIYDAATWQIAVVLGQTINHFSNAGTKDSYELANNQNKLLTPHYQGDSSTRPGNSNRATSKGGRFVYNGHYIDDEEKAYSFRMLPRSWLSNDPLMHSPYESVITLDKSVQLPPNYRLGNITWADYKPITGENAWALLLGPLQAAYIHFVKGKRQPCIPFDDLSVQNALSVLPTFAAMQSPIGAVYYAAPDKMGVLGDQIVNPHSVSVENNISLYAGLNVLNAILHAELLHERQLSSSNKGRINAALKIIKVMIDGGHVAENDPTAGLLSFFKNYAWRNNEFVQGGFANDPNQNSEWIPVLKPKAVDTNTWGIAALGAKQIDEWFGFGAAFRNWQHVKQWGGYGVDRKLWGVGYSDEDGNGINGDGTYRQGVLSAEWTAGAINMVRSMINHYDHVAKDSSNFSKAKAYAQDLKDDARTMLDGLQTLRIDNYGKTNFPGKPDNYDDLIQVSSKPYLYASKRFMIPFGWNSNPIPSTCATAWVIMLADHFDPFGYAGYSN